MVRPDILVILDLGKFVICPVQGLFIQSSWKVVLEVTSELMSEAW